MEYLLNDTESLDIVRNIQESKPGIYRIGAWSAFAIVLIYLVDLIVVAFNGLAPRTVPGLFNLFQTNRLVGLLQSISLDIIAAALHVPIFFALFISLIKIKKSFALLSISLAFAFVGIAVYFSYNCFLNGVPERPLCRRDRCRDETTIALGGSRVPFFFRREWNRTFHGIHTLRDFRYSDIDHHAEKYGVWKNHRNRWYCRKCLGTGTAHWTLSSNLGKD